MPIDQLNARRAAPLGIFLPSAAKGEQVRDLLLGASFSRLRPAGYASYARTTSMAKSRNPIGYVADGAVDFTGAVAKTNRDYD